MLLPGVCMGVMPPGVPPAPSSSPALFVLQPWLEHQGPRYHEEGQEQDGDIQRACLRPGGAVTEHRDVKCCQNPCLGPARRGARVLQGGPGQRAA